MPDLLQVLLLQLTGNHTMDVTQALQTSVFELDICHVHSIDAYHNINITPQVIIVICEAHMVAILETVSHNFPEASIILITEDYHQAAAEYSLRSFNSHYLTHQQHDLLPVLLERIVEKNAVIRTRARAIQLQQQTLLNLVNSPYVHQTWEGAIAEITRVSCQALQASRVSIWLYNQNHSSIYCEKMYKLLTDDYEESMILTATDYPGYFEALRQNRVIAAHNAHVNPATMEFMETYLKPFQIESLLDAPIRVSGDMIGVICAEQTGQIRSWTLDDQHFMVAIADLTAQAYESAERRRIQEALRASESSALAFQDQLRRLHEVSLILSGTDSFDELCRQAIELGRSHLGFDRLGLWFRDMVDPQMIVGAFGIDEQGQIRDERGIRMMMQPDGIFEQMLAYKTAFRIMKDTELFDDAGRVVGHGWWASATMWDGDKVIGWLSADNLMMGGPFTEQQGELLKLYGLTLGYLCTQKRTQEALRQSEADAREFQEKLRRLHEVSLILSASDSFDDLCRKAVELGRDRLGFSRLGLWFRDERFPDLMYGAFGIDEQGQVRDERDIHLPLKPGVFYDMLQDNESLHVWDEAPLYNHRGKVVGQGWIASASLWDGRSVIGWLNADNLNGAMRPSKQQGELLKLYGLTLGHLCTEKRIHSALKQRETYLKEAEEIAGLGHFVFDLQTRSIEWVNGIEHIFEYDFGPGFSFDDLQRFLSADDFNNLHYDIENATTSEGPLTFERDLMLGDGRVKNLFVSTQPILDDEGKSIQIFGIVQDITERRLSEAQRAMLKAEQQRVSVLRDFITNATHDVMTPLTIMKSSSYVLSKSDDREEIARHRTILDVQVRRLEDMFRDMLIVSQLDNMTSLDLSLDTVDLNQDMVYWSGRPRLLAQDKDQQFVFEPSPEPLVVDVDKYYMQLMVVNVLENAVQFTPEKGQVTLKLIQNGNDAQIIVADTGVGIDLIEQEGIFDRFYRSEKHRPTNAGSGLGLTIVKQIIDLHKGQIGVESEPGKGTTFIISLPITPK